MLKRLRVMQKGEMLTSELRSPKNISVASGQIPWKLLAAEEGHVVPEKGRKMAARMRIGSSTVAEAPPLVAIETMHSTSPTRETATIPSHHEEEEDTHA